MNGLTYVLPLKWAADDPAEFADLTAYLERIAEAARIIVVDGSPEPVFARHRKAWGSHVEHLRPRGNRSNGKVNGVDTGIHAAATERLVIADDDVRYTAEQLHRVAAMLDEADLVGPQNVFAEPMPWHARWDSARSLLNRAVAADYPGTFAIRRATYLAMGGYDGDVLFENLELMRTVRAWGGVVRRPRDLYVVRRPPTTDRFLDQRVRQAYDDFAQPWRLIAFLTVAPAVAAALKARRADRIVGAAAALIAVAEIGRRRAGGRAVYGASVPAYAPLWVAERAVCSWLAVGARLRGGAKYAGGRLRVAAHDPWTLRRRAARRRAQVAGGGTETGGLVRPVAERLEQASSATAERDGAPVQIDLRAVGGLQPHRAAHDERAVGVRRDGHRLVCGGSVHPALRSPAGASETA